jgi:hypothetical protein
MVRPIVPFIPFQGNKNQLGKKTVMEFKLSEKEKKMSEGIGLHKVNHIGKNILMAGKVREKKLME